MSRIITHILSGGSLFKDYTPEQLVGIIRLSLNPGCVAQLQFDTAANSALLKRLVAKCT